MLLCPWRVRVGRAVIIDAPVIVSMETIVDGVPNLVRGRRWRLSPVMVICEGRDLRVWMSMPEIERIDSWDEVRLSAGCKVEVHWWSWLSNSDSWETSEGVLSSSSEGMLGVCKSGISSTSSSSS